MKTKLLLPLLFLTACSSLSTTQKSSLESAAITAANSLISSAASTSTATSFASGATVALRSLEGSLVTSQNVQAVVNSFGPSANTLQWSQLAANLANAYASANPKTPTAASQALEALAQGLDSATAK